MKYFVKTIALFSALTFAGCQLVRDSDGFYTIESRNKDVSKRQQTQEKKKITALDTDTISIKDTKRQEIDTKNIDTSKYIDEPANGGMENKQMVVEKMEQVVREAKDDAKHPNRFVVETSANNEEKKQECNCRCGDNNKPANTQENILKLIKKNPNITQTEMAKILGITRDGISYNIKQLKNKGIIERVGATKNGKWVIVKK